MYGGGHYVMSAARDMTPQGKAIWNAACVFGDGKSLPFAPCKRYYNPYSFCFTDNGNGEDGEYTDKDEDVGGGGGGKKKKKKMNKQKKERMYACRIHNDLRKKRLKREGGKWRGGEKALDDFWMENSTTCERNNQYLKQEAKNDSIQRDVHVKVEKKDTTAENSLKVEKNDAEGNTTKHDSYKKVKKERPTLP